MAEVTQTPMTMYYLDLLPYDDIAKDGEEGEDGWEGCLPIYHEKGDMVDFQAVGKVANAGSAFISMSDDNDFVPTVYEFLGAISVGEATHAARITYRR